jgi:mannose-6-phosphate isomerase-like protein (cupin superfamily)
MDKKPKRFKIPGGTEGILFPPDKNKAQQIAIVTMRKGVYPEKGYSINDVCTETMYLLNGKLAVTINNKKYMLKPGGLISVYPGQKYTVKGTGTSIDVITPAWDAKQNRIMYRGKNIKNH